jgi:hypothetical protein
MDDFVRVQEPLVHFQDALALPAFALDELQAYQVAKRVEA